MARRIHLVQHAESVHNIDKDFSRRDPELTSLGSQQAEALGQIFLHSKDIGLIFTSPLCRTMQTTLLAFPNVLDKTYYDEKSGKGVVGGAKLLLDPDLQERSALACDVGSETRDLEAEFPSLDFSGLKLERLVKEGVHAADDNAVALRAAKLRGQLLERSDELMDAESKDIVVITHGVFVKFLSGDQGIDLPKAGWRSYTIKEAEEEGATLTPV